MKILFSTDKYYPTINGVITSMMNLKKELEKMGHEVKVLTLSETTQTYYEDDIIYIGSFNADMIYPDIRIKHPIPKKIVEGILAWEPDIIHANSEFSTYYIVKEISRIGHIPMVMTYHTDYEDYLHYVSLANKMGLKILYKYIRYVARHFNRVIAPTEKTKKQLEGYKISPEIDVIPTGLDLDKFKVIYTKEELDKIKDKHGINKDLATLVYVGRLGKEKNLEEIISNLSDYKNYPFQLVIVGGGPDEEDIKDQVKKYNLEDKVIFTGMVPQAEIVSYYSLGDIFVSASQSETQGLTFIEALCAGVPLLCKEDQSLVGVVEEGKNGYTFKTKEEFTRYLDSLLSDKEKLDEMKKYAKEDALNRFGSVIFAEKVLECYAKAMAIKTKPPKFPLYLRLYYRFKKVWPLI